MSHTDTEKIRKKFFELLKSDKDNIELILKLGPEILPDILAVIISKPAETEWETISHAISLTDIVNPSAIIQLAKDMAGSPPPNEVRQALKAIPKETVSFIKTLGKVYERLKREIEQRDKALKVMMQIDVPLYFMPEILHAITGPLDERYLSKLLKRFGLEVFIYLDQCKDPQKETIFNALCDSFDHKTILDYCIRNGLNKLTVFLDAKYIRKTRANALAVLEQGTEKSADILKAVFNMAKTEEIETLVASALKELGRYDLNTLLKGLKSGYASMQYCTLEAISRLGETAAQAYTLLVPFLKNPDERFSRAAAEAISNIRPAAERIMELLQLALNDASQVIRLNALYALSHIPDLPEEVLIPFGEVLADKEPKIRSFAVEILRNFGIKAKRYGSQLFAMWEESGDDRLLSVLCIINEPRAIDVLLRKKFECPSSYYMSSYLQYIMERILGYEGIAFTEQFLIYTFKASSYTLIHYGEDDDYTFSLQESENAVKNLIGINCPLTSNILHLIACKPDVSVPDVGYIRFEEQRAMAVEELKKRNNPPYSLEAYFI